MEPITHIITSVKEFGGITSSCRGLLACDTETAHDSVLLGISLSCESEPNVGIYVPLVQWNGDKFESMADPNLRAMVFKFICSQSLIGYNYTYDKRFIDETGNIDSNWTFDCRIGWHLASAPAGPKPYGLKDAQVELLGWPRSNEAELKASVEARGGKLKNGDHYLASLPILGKYAALDAISTIQVYLKLKPFFDENDYWEMMPRMMRFQQLLERGTAQGIACNRTSLQKAHERYLTTASKQENIFLKTLKEEINELESDWRDRRISLYKREYNRQRYLEHPEEWERFNINSDKHKRELFYDKLRQPVETTTDGGKAAVTEDAVSAMLRRGTSDKIGKALKSYLRYEGANTLSSNFTQLYLKHTESGRLHPRYNIAGTVSYRLAGFKPHFLNAPFEEKEIMQCFTCDEGYTGVHADLTAIEPTLTAHYSEDPTLLKVFRDGLGDIYLDLALDLFPNDKELKDGYNPRIPITGAVKERFSRQRKISKIIQLAVSYTGTGHTVAKSLSAAGFPVSVEDATILVRAYWRKFRRVAEFQYQLREVYRREGQLANVAGRIIRVPDPEYKDLFNRFIQSGGHDVLVAWVLRIYELAARDGVGIKPVILDLHDSTSNSVPTGQVTALEEIYSSALQDVSNELELSVPLKMEIKTFHSLAGLKSDE